MSDEQDYHTHLLTFSCFQKRRLFRHDDLFALFENTLIESMANLHARCIAYVIMPSHVHLIICLPKDMGSPTFRRVLKRQFSFRALKWFSEQEPGTLVWLVVRHGGRVTRRFWQAGGGYDRVLAENDEIINAVNYLHENPVKAGLVKTADEWKWSSAKCYERGVQGNVPIHMPTFL